MNEYGNFANGEKDMGKEKYNNLTMRKQLKKVYLQTYNKDKGTKTWLFSWVYSLTRVFGYHFQRFSVSA